MPAGFLEPGMYELNVMAIKATKEFQQEQIKNITYRFSVANVHPLSLKVIPSPVEVKEGTTVELKTSVVYDDGSEQTVKGSVAWKSADISTFIIDANAIATGLKEGQTTVTSSYKGLTSETAQALVYLEIGGHRLPFEPDPVINNSTLLGIDSNDNGVRDDVERWIYLNPAYNHPIIKAVAMQNARVFHEILPDPSKAKETKIYMNNAHDCRSYYKRWAHVLGEEKLIPRTMNLYKESRPIILNTKERSRAYHEYNLKLSGTIGVSSDIDTLKSRCDFNTTQVMESIK